MIPKLAIAAIWIMGAALLIRLMNLWDQLPQRVAVHFGIAMQPNGWASRSAMALLMVLVVAGHAVLATWLILNFSGRSPMIGAIQITTSAVLVSAFWQMLSFNAQGKPFQSIWILISVLLMVALIAVLLLRPALHHAPQ
ncbi:MAG TPA: DUF1648 domain-containing protein [Candidatus Angelobacter sp.]|nr:DUF1648 domain-containing protein [Candidatus Angelobacter sp.]